MSLMYSLILLSDTACTSLLRTIRYIAFTLLIKIGTVMLSFTPSLSRSPFCAVSAFPSYVILIASEHNTNSDRLTVPDSSLKQFPVSDITCIVSLSLSICITTASHISMLSVMHSRTLSAA